MFYFSGTVDTTDYIVMEDCGEAHTPPKELDLIPIDVVISRAKAMLHAVKTLHRAGFVHRDIKPGNFCDHKLIDFGLCRSLRSPRRRGPGFRGTLRYASLGAHAGRELGIEDDLVSLVYVIAEMASGRLPWAGQWERSVVAKMKACTGFSSPLLHNIFTAAQQGDHDAFLLALESEEQRNWFYTVQGEPLETEEGSTVDSSAFEGW